jgi:hypothetical protein
VARSHAEIVEKICKHLRPRKRLVSDYIIRREVEGRIALLVQIAAVPMPHGADVRRQAVTARKALGRLRTELARAPLQSFIGPHISISQSVECLDRLDEILANVRLIKAPDPRSNPMQRVCAESADALIYQFSARPATGTPEGPLYAITALLFEAVTRKPNQNVKRAVDAMIESWRGFDGMRGRGRPLSGPIKRDKWDHDVSKIKD